METIKRNTCFAKIILTGVLVFFQYYFIYKYTYSFNFLQIWGETYYLPLIIACASLLLVLVLLYKKIFSYSIFEIVVPVLLAIYLLLLLIGTTIYNFDNEVFCNLITFICLLVSLRLAGRDFILSIVFPVTLLFFLAELYQGYAALITHALDTNLHLLIMGHLENSGIYSIYLVTHLPLVTFYSRKICPGRKKSNIMVATCYISVGVLLIFTGSRAAICGALFYFLAQGFSGWRYWKRSSIKILVITGAAGLIAGLLFLKPLSALGRLNIWKITLMHSSEHFWTGVGYGQFHKFYPQWQIEYFSKLPANRITEVSFAGEVYVAYNEFIQLFAEVGFLGCIGLIVMFAMLFFTIRLKKDGLAKQVCYIFVITFIACLFSYPLHVNVIMVFLSISVAYLLPNIGAFNINRTVYLWPILAGFLLMIILKSIKVYSDAKLWQKTAGNVFQSDSIRLKSYESLYSGFRNNSKFLLDYGIFLYTIQNPRSVEVLNESKNISITVATLQTLAQVYESQDEWHKAVQAWEALSCLIPYKYSYKSKLMDLYITTGDTLSAKKTAKLIITMPIKKDDELTKYTKIKAERILGIQKTVKRE